MKSMIGTFNFHDRGVAILHFLPQGEVREGHPIIVFPQRDHQIIAGKTYEFYAKLTADATYVVDGQVYRVAHAIAPREVSDTEGDFVDTILHHRAGPAAPVTLADTPAGAALLAWRQRLQAA